MHHRAKSAANADAGGKRRCRNGHTNTYLSPKGKAVCRTCRNARHRAYTEVKRQARLKARRSRILARSRPHRRERIWAAGLFEGEGTITIRSSGVADGTVPEVSVVSTDRNVIDVFQAAWPGMLEYYTPPSKNGLAREAVIWKRRACELVECFLLDIRPYLKTPRVRRKADLLLADIRERVECRITDRRKRRRLERMAEMRALNRRGIVR